MTWADVGAILFGFLVFAGVGASSAWLALRTQTHRRSRGEHDKADWLDVLDAFEGTPGLSGDLAFSRPSAARLRRRA